MTLQIDHIVHFIHRHPKEIVDILKEKGFKAIMGGQHEHWGTYNSLLYSKKSYIEFLSVENKEVANKSDNPLIQQLTNFIKYGEGLGQVCFRTNNILQLKEMLIDQGYSTSKIINGSRKREDGKMIRWKMLFITDECELPYPFFIEWEQTDMERLKDLSEQGLIDISDLSYQLSKNDQRLYQICFDPALGKRAFDLFGGCYR